VVRKETARLQNFKAGGKGRTNPHALHATCYWHPLTVFSQATFAILSLCNNRLAMRPTFAAAPNSAGRVLLTGDPTAYVTFTVPSRHSALRGGVLCSPFEIRHTVRITECFVTHETQSAVYTYKKTHPISYRGQSVNDIHYNTKKS